MFIFNLIHKVSLYSISWYPLYLKLIYIYY
nr:MAG TPA: Protein of unknown function (DUF789) [Caudoviricetes sp.]DAX54701.1 MAG TPA: Protein of unknown function (DUF789) [Caudoviricetes sp.]